MAVADVKTRPPEDLSRARTSRDKTWLQSISRFVARRGPRLAHSVLRSLRSPAQSSPVAFSRERQAVAISAYAKYMSNENESYSFAMSSASESTSSNPCATPCSRATSLQICDTCKSAINWYFGNLSRQVTEHILHSQPAGTFLVRNSISRHGNFALSVRVHQDDQRRPTGVAHYLLVKSPKSRVQIKGFKADFDCVQSLLLHYSQNPELLSCKLRFGSPELTTDGADMPYHNHLRLTALAILTRS